MRRLDDVGIEEGDRRVVGLYVITGTAGVGKTSLALHWAHSARHRFPNGQLYINLRGYDPGLPVSPEQALDQFLRALGVPPNGIPVELEDRAALYRSLLADRRMLVILDNAATVKQVRPLLPGNAECLVLVTSRDRFSGLVARDGAHRLPLDTLSEQEAVALLRTVTAGYRKADDLDELTELARLCARLPLALRIAAERASSRPLMLLNELIADLRDESALWDALSADSDDEADAVRTVFAWSYRALSEPAARLFRLLGLHPGPEFGVQAAATLGDVGTNQVRQLLDVLVGAHVLEHHAPGRYQFHDLLRAYATEQAFHHESQENRVSTLERAISWYAQTAHNAVTAIAPLDRHIDIDHRADVAPLTFTDRDSAFQWYETERENLVASVRHAAEAGLYRPAWQLPAMLRSIYVTLNPFEEWITTGRIGLDSARTAGDRFGEAELLDSLGKAYLQSHQLEQAEEYHRSALAIRQEIGDRYGEGVATNALGLLDWRRRRLRGAVDLFEASMRLFRDLGNRRWQALVTTNLGMAHHDLGDLEQAEEALLAATAICRELGDRAYEGNALFFLARTQRELGNLEEAMASILQALDIARDDNHHAWEAFWLVELARIQRDFGQAAEALISYQHSAVIQRQIGDRSREAAAVDGTGEAYRELGRPDEAVKFHRLAVATFRDVDDRWPLAAALVNLATALEQIDDAEDVQPYLTEADAILVEFDDPRAVMLRSEVRSRRPDSEA